ncbi:alkaline phosphatase [Clostridiales bacterium PH28_bin88]|nr:alkaline phosphatase [Clostridiales bacterium PH28_bin88]
MVTIKDFIQNRLRNRMQQNGVLVVYDPEGRYRNLCLELANDEIRVIDASESSIESREAALHALRELGQPNPQLKGMLVYVPAKVPLIDEEKQRDPFALYMVCGSMFPDSDSDEYINLCLTAKPDHATQIRRIFSENPNPPFSVIDAVGGGTGWPNLQAFLGVESARDILFALMSPSEVQEKALKDQDTWVSEARDLFQATLGLKLISRSKTWASIADELWRFLLFSEFVFDLSEALPDSLANVPRAHPEARPLVEDLCDRLRNDRRTQVTYIERAEAIEKELDLPAHCKGMKDLGVNDTFPFEERCSLEQAMGALNRGDTDAVRVILGRREHSVWTGKGESQAQWAVIRAALNVVEVCEDGERQLPDHAQSQETLIDFYIGCLCEVDRLHREFEQAVGDYIDIQETMGDLVGQVRSRYQRLTSKVHDLFIRYLEKSGWPPVGRLANADLFDVVIAPRLQESGRRVALFLVDALRYELGVVLEKQLSEEGQVELRVSFAQLPSITQVGMASLLPEAGQKLMLKRSEKGDILPMLGDIPVANVNQRMDVLRKRYGQRFAEISLKNFIRSKSPLPSTVDLLVLRSEQIDAQLETDPETALGLIHDSLKRIRVAVHKLEGMGFHEVVVATDHGFVLNTPAKAGDVCTKPQGDWINIHERSLLGRGTADAANFAITTERAGIRADFEQLAGPRGLVPYRAGLLYFHGGASLQEAVLPVITLRLRTKEPDYRKPTVKISYKNGAKRITTRRPVLEVTLECHDLFAQDTDFEILLEAHDKKGNVVGEAKAGSPVNPATGTIHLKPGERVRVTMKMNPEFEGNFMVKAMNPTTLATYCKLDLETDYVV